jgi:methionyl-tRNA formyltransferase
LSYIIDISKTHNIQITAVLTNNNRHEDENSLKKLANDNGIECLNELDEIIKIQDIDYIISVQYHKILKKEHINIAKKLAINLHMAPLPEFRGCNQFTFALLNDFKQFGTTLHELNEGIDSGPIIAEKRFQIHENCFVDELFKLTETHSFELFKDNILNILSGEYVLIDQSKLIEERGTNIHYRKEINNIKIIDLKDSPEIIYKKIRATSFPGFEFPYTYINNEKIYLIHEKYLKN